jgi:phosphoglycolate phosphatase
VPDADELHWCIGPPLRGAFAKLLDTSEDAMLDRALALYRDRFSSTGLYENALYP